PGSSVPPQLRARIAVNSTPCSVTCGLGVRQQRLCEVTPDGKSGNCSLVRSPCLSDRICGLRHLGVPEGKPFRLSCLSPDAWGLQGHDFSYSWSFARGLVTTNDLLLRPLRNPSPSLSFSPALESHSGTYRCDVQERSSFELVKRIYFGLRVVPTRLADLDFQKSLTWEQQLLENGEGAGNGSGPGERDQQRRWKFSEKQWFYEVVLGVGSGIVLGVVFSLGLCCL
ncbi:TMM81 protein, partial [Dasyornis broadbenti]|nr:TMM81 protein [Dasyornis broadbenti]